MKKIMRQTLPQQVLFRNPFSNLKVYFLLMYTTLCIRTTSLYALGSSLEPWSKTKSTFSQSGSQDVERVV